jgi:glycosyltransferase involved in cell wall biosynthesis
MNILGLFFTENVSLKDWFEKGLLDREKLLYEGFIKRSIFSKIFWFTYGTKDFDLSKKLKKEGKLDNNIVVISKPRIFIGRAGSLVYSFLMPFVHKSKISKCNFLKTNQMMGSWSAVFSKIIFKKKLIVRTGYTQSIFTKNKQRFFRLIIIKLIERLAYKFADYSIVSSKYDFDYIKKEYNAKRVLINYNFIDTNIFSSDKSKKINDIVYIGRYTKQKNLVNLIKAVSKTKFNLTMYGKGELKKDLLELVEKLNAKNKIKINGIVSNSRLPKILNESKMYILVSNYEGMPKTLLEAMSCGVACLGTDVTGINEIIENNKNGLLVKTKEDDIFEGIEKIMKNQSLAKKIGENARLKIEKDFSLNKILDKEIEIYKKLEK